MPGYSNLDQMFDKHKVDMVCAIVSCRANHEIVSQVAQRGYSCVLETPIEFDLKKAHAMFDLIRQHKVRIEISENGFRMPAERIVKKLLDAGLFGNVLVAHNDVRAHGYHGISILRNYVGFDVAPVSVTGHHPGVASSDANGNEQILKTRFGIIEFAIDPSDCTPWATIFRSTPRWSASVSWLKRAGWPSPTGSVARHAASRAPAPPHREEY